MSADSRASPHADHQDALALTVGWLGLFFIENHFHQAYSLQKPLSEQNDCAN
ncbi:hypothetical protein [Rubripirellula obstinata]|uniref:hypothetical protein n=1 Tax=Rubripirellula obstinata TaxID=406547 RepID=UPI00138FF237|nr:hypothetical protein [Rubripirellula obstinata]